MFGITTCWKILKFVLLVELIFKEHLIFKEQETNTNIEK